MIGYYCDSFLLVLEWSFHIDDDAHLVDYDADFGVYVVVVAIDEVLYHNRPHQLEKLHCHHHNENIFSMNKPGVHSRQVLRSLIDDPVGCGYFHLI